MKLIELLSNHIKKYYPIYLFIIVFSIAILLVYIYVRKYENKTIAEKAKVETLNRKKAIEEYLVQSTTVLELIQTYFQKNQNISRADFAKLVDPTLKITDNIQAIEWVPRVEERERGMFEHLAQKEGFLTFEFKEFDDKGNISKAKIRNYYYPIYYLEPITSNEKAFGFDLSTRSFAYKSINSAIEKHGRAFSPGLKLIQDSLAFGFAVYLPVYSNEPKASRKLKGFVAGIFKTSKIVEHALKRFSNDLAIKISDCSDSLKTFTIYSYAPKNFVSINQNHIRNSSLRLNQLTYRYPIKIENLSWIIEFTIDVENEPRSLSQNIFILCIQLIFFISLFFLLSYKYSLKLKKYILFIKQEEDQRLAFENELEQSEEKYYKLFFSSPIPISFVRLYDRTIVDVNPAFEKKLGYKKDDILGKKSNDFGLWVYPGDWHAFYKVFLNKGELIYQEAQIQNSDGLHLTCLISGSIVKLKNQDYIFAFFQDISKRKEAEEALKLSQAKYHDIFNSVNDAIIVNDIETGAFVDANKKALEMFKYTTEEFNNIDMKMLSSGVQPFQYENLKKCFFDTNKPISSETIEWQAKDKYGKIFWVELNFKRLLFIDKYRIITVCRDISERKKAENLLVENEFLFRNQFNNSNIGISISTPEKQFVRANKKFCELVGYSEEELQEKKWSDITYPEDIEIQMPLFNKIISGEQDIFEIDKRYINKNGNIVYTHLAASCFRNPDGSIHYIISNILDISDRIEMENKILKAIIETEENERTRFAQELHDGLGPILSSIKMYTQWMAKPNANLDQAEALKHMENLISLAHQSAREVAFGLSPHILKDFGLTEALNSFVNKIKGDETPSIIINSNLTSRLNETVETIVYRILIECINNSLKHSHANLIKIDLTRSEMTINIDYFDNGVGFLLNEVIDKKMGMGIYNIQNRLKSINGNITINSQPDKGTIIKMTIKL